MSKLSEAIPNRVRALRLEREWSLAELAERVGSTPSQILKLEKSQRRLDFDWVSKFAKAFEISELELVGQGASTDAVTEVPVVGSISAGNWHEAVQHAVETISVPASLLPGPNIFALKPIGTSMNLLVEDDGHVLINPDDADLRDGKVYAVMRNDGETTLKRYRADPARLEPCSSDPSHQPITLGKEPFIVIGRAIRALNPL